jgi:hypothetical protein
MVMGTSFAYILLEWPDAFYSTITLFVNPDHYQVWIVFYHY